MKKVFVLSCVLLFHLVTYCSEHQETPFQLDLSTGINLIPPSSVEDCNLFTTQLDQKSEIFSWLDRIATLPPLAELPNLEIPPDSPEEPVQENRGIENYRHCSQCNRNIPRSSYRGHRSRHRRFDSNAYPCHISSCKFRTSSLAPLADHHEEEHGKGQKLLCKCGCNKWIGVSTWYKHKQKPPRHKNGAQRNLQQCCICFFKYDNLKKHQRTHTGGMRISCDACTDFVTNSHQAMNKHRKKKHNINDRFCRCTTCKTNTEGGTFVALSTYFKHRKATGS